MHISVCSDSNWPKYECPWGIFLPPPFFSSSFICLSLNLFNSASFHLPLLKCCHSFFSHLVALLLVSPANMICLFRSVSTCILLSSILFYMVLPSIHRSIMLPPHPPSSLIPTFRIVKWLHEMSWRDERDCNTNGVTWSIVPAPLINEFNRALALWWTMLIRHGNPNKDVSR